MLVVVKYVNYIWTDLCLWRKVNWHYLQSELDSFLVQVMRKEGLEYLSLSQDSEYMTDD